MSDQTEASLNTHHGAIAIPLAVSFEERPMRERIKTLRDTAIVLGMQIVFRATMLLRHLNY